MVRNGQNWSHCPKNVLNRAGFEMSGVLEELGKLSPAVQGAVVGGVIALMGTALTVIAAAFTTFHQLRQDRTERKADRALQLKKEELLAALEGVALAQSAIGDLSNPDVADGVLNDRVQQGLKSGQRAHAVAEVATVRAGAEWSRQFAHVYFKLLPRRLELLMLNTDAILAKGNVDKVLADQSQLVELRQSALLSGNEDSAQRISRAFEAKHSGFDPAFAEMQRTQELVMAFRKSMMVDCIRAQLDLRPKYNSLVESIRRETGVDGPTSQFSEAVNADENELFEMIDRLMADAAEVEKRTVS